MKCIDRTDTFIGFVRKIGFALALLGLSSTSARAASAISIQGPRQVLLPGIAVTSSPQQIYSGVQTILLKNKNAPDGWILSGDISNGSLTGNNSGEQIPAVLQFISITWLKGGNGSAAGITIHSNGTAIEADPGFGIGDFEIEFEIRYDTPAFPTADQYQGVSTFIVQ